MANTLFTNVALIFQHHTPNYHHTFFQERIKMLLTESKFPFFLFAKCDCTF